MIINDSECSFSNNEIKAKVEDTSNGGRSEVLTCKKTITTARTAIEPNILRTLDLAEVLFSFVPIEFSIAQFVRLYNIKYIRNTWN